MYYRTFHSTIMQHVLKFPLHFRRNMNELEGGMEEGHKLQGSGTCTKNWAHAFMRKGFCSQDVHSDLGNHVQEMYTQRQLSDCFVGIPPTALNLT